MRSSHIFLIHSILITRFAKIKIKTIIALKPYLFNWLFITSKTKIFNLDKISLPFYIFRQSIFSFHLNGKFMFTIYIEMFIVNKRRIEITILTYSIVFTINTFKTRANDRFHVAEFTSIFIMCGHSES
jgi:hypothetical protein